MKEVALAGGRERREVEKFLEGEEKGGSDLRSALADEPGFADV